MRGLAWLAVAASVSAFSDCDERSCTCRNQDLHCSWRRNVTADAPFLFCVEGRGMNLLRAFDAVVISTRFTESLEIHAASEDTWLSDLARKPSSRDRARIALESRSAGELAWAHSLLSRVRGIGDWLFPPEGAKESTQRFSPFGVSCIALQPRARAEIEIHTRRERLRLWELLRSMLQSGSNGGVNGGDTASTGAADGPSAAPSELLAPLARGFALLLLGVLLLHCAGGLSESVAFLYASGAAALRLCILRSLNASMCS